MSSKFLCSLIILLCVCGNALSYKILVLCALPTRSHNNLGKGIVDILHDAKHEVTYVTTFPQEGAKYRQIETAEMLATKDGFQLSFETSSKTSAVGMFMNLPAFVNGMVEGLFNSKNFQKLLSNKNEKFDLVIVEYFMNEAFLGLGVKYDCPIIMLSPISMMHWLARSTGNPISPATVPNAVLNFGKEMTFTQRLANTATAIGQELLAVLINYRRQEEIYKKHFPEEAAKVPFSELHKKIAMVFSNSHPSIGNARPLLPNTIEIGGYHIGDSKALPEEYKKILDAAKDGVIYFSMGSNLKSADMSQKIKNDILKAFSKRKEIVLWKYEEDFPNKPNNVLIKSWMPQTSILSHPNVKVFISHGGFLSTTEAASSGVPVLSIPIYGDQFTNAEATQNRGCGITLLYSNLTDSSLTWALNEIIGNPKYAATAKVVHTAFNDRPMSPKRLVSFYTEHVIRTGGAKHLSAPHLPLYASLLLDVIAVLLLPPLLLILVTVWICKKCCRKSKKQIKEKQKKH